MPGSSGRLERFRERLGLESNIVAVSAAMLLLSLGESLWRKFLPKYLQALGAPIRAVGLFGSIEDFLDGVYQYPGGWLGDHLGRRRAAPVRRPGARRSCDLCRRHELAVGDRRTPVRAGLVEHGQPDPVRRGRRCASQTAAGDGLNGPATNIRGVWRAIPPPLRWLLLTDVFIRTCEGLVDEFAVIYALNIIRLSAPQYGLLIAIQAVTSIIVYIPASTIADRIGGKPFVTATFLFFSLFPIALVMSKTFIAAAGAFVIGGLREIGEPSRNALIVDLAAPAMRARTVGLYYLIRSVAIAPAAFIGGLLWEQRPALPFFGAFAVGLAGTTLFAAGADR